MSAAQDIPRDRWDRPLVIPPGGGTPVAYTRVSRLAKAPDDVGGLINWSAAQAVRGLVARRDLFELACSAKFDDDPDKQIRDITKRAKDAAASDEAANLGTMLHRWTELLDLGEATLDDVPPDYRDLLSCYVEEMRPFEIIDTELFVVTDPVTAAGTLDRLVRLPDGAVVVADVKTGKSAATYGAQGVAIQTAVYANGKRYNPETGERTPLHPDLDRSRCLLIHMPLTNGLAAPQVDLHVIDATMGWAGAILADDILRWRKTSPLTPWFMSESAQKVS